MSNLSTHLGQTLSALAVGGAPVDKLANTNIERTLTLLGATATMALIITGHGPGRWLWEGVIDSAPFVEPALHHITNRFDREIV